MRSRMPKSSLEKGDTDLSRIWILIRSYSTRFSPIFHTNPSMKCYCLCYTSTFKGQKFLHNHTSWIILWISNQKEQTILLQFEFSTDPLFISHFSLVVWQDMGYYPLHFSRACLVKDIQLNFSRACLFKNIQLHFSRACLFKNIQKHSVAFVKSISSQKYSLAFSRTYHLKNIQLDFSNAYLLQK